ncbi:MAG: SpoIVB peptidase S55 domain-containing protein [Janthinobacterium lividum]
MTSRSRFTLSAAVAALVFTTLPIQARPPVPLSHPAPNNRLKWDSKKFMHVSELRPGMRGYALTVFKGTKIEKFGIEILGVVAKFNEGKDYIMFRATSGPPVTRGLGIAEGMSGSPIYIGRRLVGAISLGDSFGKDPIGFATPIEDMFDAWSPDLPATMSNISASPSPVSSGSTKMESENYQGQNFQSEMPLTVSGMNAQGLSRLGAALAPFHFRVMAGAGMGEDVDTNPLAKNPSLVPGSAVGVALVQGDFDANATGTVTYRDGNRLLLFGHPFQNLGPIDAALTTAYVVDIFPSYQTSFKLGSPIKTVGRIFQDRPFSVGGIIGPMPQMIPMTVSVNDESIHRRKDFHVRLINHPLLTGRLIPAIAGAAINQVHGDPGDSMATVSMDVDAEEIGHIKRTNVYFDSLNIDQTATGDLSSLVSLLSSNPFYPLAVKSVKMIVTIQNRHDTAEIDHLFVNQSKYAPGDTINVGVVLKPYKQPLYTQMIAVKIPLSTPDGTLPLNIQGGAAGDSGASSLLAMLLGGAPSEPVGTSATISQLVKHFEEKPQNNQLVAHLTLPTSAVSIQGEKLTGLPPTLSAIMQSPRTTGFHSVRDEVKVPQTVPYLVSGSQTLNIQVQRKDLSDNSHPSASSSPSSVTSSPAPSTAPPAMPTDDTDNMAYDNMALVTDALAKKSASLPTQAPSASTTVTTTSTTPTSTTTTTSTTDSAADTSTAATVKPVGRLPSIWRQNTQTDFATGLLTNVTVSSLGDVRLSPSLTKVADTTANFIWAIQPDGKGNTYLATGDSGVIYKMDADGKVSPFYKTGELEAMCLTLDDAGNLYVGTAPNGVVFRVAPNGKGSKVFTAKEKYVTGLAQSNGEIYVATGGGTGRVYHIGTDTPFFTSPEAHILSLTADKDGTLYAGSAPDGIVYKIASDGSSSVLYDATEPNITALTTDSQGNVYAGTSPTGNVYRIASDGTAKRLTGLSSTGITSLKTNSTDAVYATAGNTIYKISPDNSVQSYMAQTDQQFISLGLDSGTGAVYAGTGTVGSVYKIGAAGSDALSGTLQSTVHDAGRRAQWGTLSWRTETPGGSAVTLETRSGDVARPDSSWSSWSAPYTQAGGEAITSPPARYLQYKAQFSGADSASAPKLTGVSVYYLPHNQPPTVSMTKPAAGDAVSKTTTFQWTASDPDKDTLSYDVSYSGDSGKTWTPITTSAKLTAQTKNKTVTKTTRTRPAQTTVPAAALNSLSSAPPAVQAQIQAQIAANSVTTAPTTSKSAQNLKETSYSWDTSQVPDGYYQVEVVASDKPSNPVGALTAKIISAPFLIDNTAPTLILGTPTVNADKSVTLHGTVQSTLAFVQAVQAKADDGDLIAASADDGLFDSTHEPFTLTVSSLTSGSHKIEVQALDQAGNKTVQTVSVTVP